MSDSSFLIPRARPIMVDPMAAMCSQRGLALAHGARRDIAAQAKRVVCFLMTSVVVVRCRYGLKQRLVGRAQPNCMLCGAVLCDSCSAKNTGLSFFGHVGERHGTGLPSLLLARFFSVSQCLLERASSAGSAHVCVLAAP